MRFAIKLCRFLKVFAVVAIALSRPGFADENGVGQPTRSVVVYVANTPHRERLEEIVELMQDHPSSAIQKTLGRIKNDMAEFGPAVEAETATLRTRALAGEFDLIVFTNEAVREGIFEVIATGCSIAVRLPKARSTEAAPLEKAATLQSLLLQTRSLFAGRHFQFTLIIKSHGNASLAMTSILDGKLDAYSSSDLAQESQIKTNHQIAAQLDTSVSVEDATLNREDNTTLSIDDNTSLFFDAKTGLPKDQLVGIIRELARHDMRFQLLVLEACYSQLSADQLKSLRPAVSTIVTTNAAVKYHTVNYGMSATGSFNTDVLLQLAKVKGFNSTQL